MHHAYIYEGSLGLLPALTEAARELFHFTKPNDPDVQVLEIEKFGIEEARELVRSASLKSMSGRALYIVGTSSITSDAQQALLKLFEEPQEGATFVLLAPYGTIIATLRSRMLKYPSQQIELKKVLGSEAAQSFLQKNNKARSAEITKLLKDEEGTRERVREFLSALEVSLHDALLKSKGKKEVREGLEDIAKVRSYANDRAPAMKMLLEHLALSLPQL